MITAPHRTGTIRRAHPARVALVVRLLWVTVAGQLIGYALGALAGAGAGLFGRAPGLGLVVSVGAGLVAGTAVGLAVAPSRRRTAGLALITLVLAAVISVLLIMLAQARLPTGLGRPGPMEYGPTVLVTAFGQGLVGWLIWTLRSDRRRGEPNGSPGQADRAGRRLRSAVPGAVDRP